METMKKILLLMIVLGIADWIRDNNVHFILKGLLAAKPLLALLALGTFLFWQGKDTKAHTHYREGSGNQSFHTGDPAAAARARAERLGVDVPGELGD